MVVIFIKGFGGFMKKSFIQGNVAKSNTLPKSRPFYCVLRKCTLVSFVICVSANTVLAEDLSGIRSIIKNAPENSWIQMNTNKIMDAWVPKALRPNDGNPASVINAWSSFAWDSNRGDLLIFGGGHANYAGNEVYRWRGSTQNWELAALPSALGSRNIPVGGAEYAPESSHTYDNSVFLPLADRFVTFGGAAYQTGGPFFAENADGTLRRTGPYFFDPSKANPNKVGGADSSGVDPATPGGYMWDNRDIYARPSFVTAAPGSTEGTTDYTLENGKEVIYISGPDGGGSEHRLAKLTINDYSNPSKDEWELLGINWFGSGGQGAGAYDPLHNLYIKTLNESSQFTFWNLDNPGAGNTNQLVTLSSVPSNFVMKGQYGLEYDPIRDRFLLWGAGGEVFQLNVGNKDGTDWVVSQLTTEPNSSVPTPFAQIVNGQNDAVLGKWHYASDLDVFVGLQGGYDGNIWFFKPSDWVDTSIVPLPGGLPLMLSGIGFLVLATRKKYRF